jgi:hypothetical protein
MKTFYKSRNIQRSRMTPCPRDDDLKNGSCRKGERAHLQNSIKAKPEQLNLSKTYSSKWS